MLGRLGAVVRRRHGRIIREELREGEDVFDVSAAIPVLESFGLADDIRKRTSGHALQPQLRFTHWEVQEFDPLGEPGEDDDEEREDWFRTIRLINVSWERFGENSVELDFPRVLSRAFVDERVCSFGSSWWSAVRNSEL